MNIQFPDLEFQWKDLNGKTLEFVVQSAVDSLWREEVTVLWAIAKKMENTT